LLHRSHPSCAEISKTKVAEKVQYISNVYQLTKDPFKKSYGIFIMTFKYVAIQKRCTQAVTHFE